MLDRDLLHEGLTRVRALVATPERWTKRAMSRDAKKKSIEPTHENAVAFDLAGALFRAGYDLANMRVTDELHDLLTRMSGGREDDRLWLIEWQDAPSRKHPEVLRLVDDALSTLTPEGPTVGGAGAADVQDDI